jgi:hypothetical protein
MPDRATLDLSPSLCIILIGETVTEHFLTLAWPVDTLRG